MQNIYPWQKKEWQQLTKRWQSGKLPHGLLLTGTSGLGKNDFAVALAELLLCQAAGEFACGCCRACQLLQAGNHPDFMQINPEKVGGAIKIDQIRALISDLSQTSLQGRGQVAIINPADAMNIAAANALLKTLEEPEGQVTLLLVTAQPLQLPATVRSRCQVVNFTAPSQQEAQQWLQSQMDPKYSELLLSLAENAPLAALQLYETEDLDQRELLFKHFVRLSNKDLSPLQFAEVCSKTSPTATLNTIINWVADMLKLRLGVDKTQLKNIDLHDKLLQLVDKKTATQLSDFLAKLLQFKNWNNITNLNLQLMFEDLSISWIKLC